MGNCSAALIAVAKGKKILCVHACAGNARFLKG